MTGVLDKLIWPQKILLKHSVPGADMTAVELVAAKEILAEVFRVRISEVNEMILSRFEEHLIQETCPEESRLWPQEFRREE